MTGKTQNPHHRRVTNILGIYAQASGEELAEGFHWYETAHTFAEGLALRYQVGDHQDQEKRIEAAAGVIAALSPQISWDRNMVLADRLCAGLRVTGVYSANIAKAHAIQAGAEPLEILGGNKVRAFFECIANPYCSRAVVVDRHALAIVEGRVLSEAERRGALRDRVYGEIANAYIEAARIAKLDAPHEMQAVTWLVWRRMKREGKV